jgi:hypothetical protein
MGEMLLCFMIIISSSIVRPVLVLTMANRVGVRSVLCTGALIAVSTVASRPLRFHSQYSNF